MMCMALSGSPTVIIFALYIRLYVANGYKTKYQ